MKATDIKGRMLIKRYPNWNMEEVKVIETSPSKEYFKVQHADGTSTWANPDEYKNWTLVERL